MQKKMKILTKKSVSFSFFTTFNKFSLLYHAKTSLVYVWS